MNRYSTEFVANCPINGDRVKYHLTIETDSVIPVEQISAAVDATDKGLHEDIADDLVARFGGLQVLVAQHRDVRIETVRRGSAFE